MFFQGRALAIFAALQSTPQVLIMRFLFNLASVLFLALLVSAETPKTDAPPSTNELIAEISKLPTCVVRMTVERLQLCLSNVADSHVRPHA